MKKLRLDLDRLKVESFSSTDVAEDRGTARGHSISHYTPESCGSCLTTMNDVECWQYSVYVACPNERANSVDIC
jgi:hypothetical protein